MADKAVGRGRGRFAVAGAQADQQSRIEAIEDYLADLIDSGELSAPEAVLDTEPVTPETPA